MRTLDLSEEERLECMEAYIDEFRNSKGNAADELMFKIKLRALNLDADEIHSIIWENRPSGA